MTVRVGGESLAGVVAVRILVCTTMENDRVMFKMCNVWMTVVFLLLPLLSRDTRRTRVFIDLLPHLEGQHWQKHTGRCQ